MNDPLSKLAQQLANAGEPPQEPPSASRPPDPADRPPPPPRRGSGRPRGEIWEGCPVVPLGVFGAESFYIDVLGQLLDLRVHQARIASGGVVLLKSKHRKSLKDSSRLASRCPTSNWTILPLS